MIRRLVPWLKWLVPLAAAFFIARVVYRQWPAVRGFDWRLDPAYLALSFLFTSTWYFIRGLVWRAIIQHFGPRLPYRECVRIFVLGELTRYVPGTVWQYLSRMYMAGRWGVPAAVALQSALMELLLMALAAAPLLLWHIDVVFPVLARSQRALLVVFLAAALLLLQPAVLNRLARLVLPRLRLEYAPIRMSYLTICGLWAACLGQWLLFGTGFALFVRSLAPIPFHHAVELASNYALSWLVGVATSFVAPGGIGVREGVLGVLLGKILPIGMALLIAVLSRLWLIVLELFWAAVAQVYLRVPPPGEDLR